MFDGELGRLDYNISDRHKFFYNFRHNYRVEDRGNWFRSGGIPDALGNLLNRINWGSMVDDVYTISPTLVVNTRLNWTRFTEGTDHPSLGYDFTKLGFPGVLGASSQRLVLPAISFTNFQQTGVDGGDRTPYDIFQLFATATKVHGSHTLKFGTDVREQRESSASYGNSSGLIVLPRTIRADRWTTRPARLWDRIWLPSCSATRPAEASQSTPCAPTRRNTYAIFLQDDFRPRSNLTFNLGLRFEGDRERPNGSIVPSTVSIPGPRYPSRRGAGCLCQESGRRRTAARANSRSWAG